MAATREQRDRFGKRLRALREARKFTQPALGELLGTADGTKVSGPAVSDWERGVSAPDQENVAALETIFGEPLADLLGYSGTGLVTDRLEAIETAFAELREDNVNLREMLAQILRRLDGQGSGG